MLGKERNLVQKMGIWLLGGIKSFVDDKRGVLFRKFEVAEPLFVVIHIFNIKKATSGLRAFEGCFRGCLFFLGTRGES